VLADDPVLAARRIDASHAVRAVLRDVEEVVRIDLEPVRVGEAGQDRVLRPVRVHAHDRVGVRVVDREAAIRQVGDPRPARDDVRGDDRSVPRDVLREEVVRLVERDVVAVASNVKSSASVKPPRCV
jgi:hypothetical protein